jgi:hypothetical protein
LGKADIFGFLRGDTHFIQNLLTSVATMGVGFDLGNTP